MDQAVFQFLPLISPANARLLIHLLQGKSKVAKMTWASSLAPPPLALAPRFGNNDYVTAEISVAPDMHITRCLLDRRLLCAVHRSELHHEGPAAAALGLRWSHIRIMFHEAMLWLCYGCIMVMLWLLLRLVRQPGRGLC